MSCPSNAGAGKGCQVSGGCGGGFYSLVNVAFLRCFQGFCNMACGAVGVLGGEK